MIPVEIASRLWTNIAGAVHRANDASKRPRSGDFKKTQIVILKRACRSDAQQVCRFLLQTNFALARSLIHDATIKAISSLADGMPVTNKHAATEQIKQDVVHQPRDGPIGERLFRLADVEYEIPPLLCRLLAFLHSRLDKWISRDELAKKACGYAMARTTIDSYLSRLDTWMHDPKPKPSFSIERRRHQARLKTT
jgi:hypothetical protein